MRISKFVLSISLALTFIVSTSASSADENTVIPQILSKQDIKRYQRIFELQEQGRWKQADKLIKGLDDRILMGHVQYQRYMHPKKYRSRFSELAGWMKNYADHPNAWAVYRLARKRRGKARSPRRPEDTRYPGVTGQSSRAKPPVPRRTRLERRAVSKFLANVRRHVRKGRPARAEKRFWAMEKRGLARPHELAAALERISASYYYKGNDFKALKLSTLGANLAREVEPTADWIAGLANWRLGNLKEAYVHFSYLAEAERASDWLLSAGQFWAGRTAFKLGDAYGGTEHLKAASQYSETFYGLIAGRQLGVKPDIDWTIPTLDVGAMANLMRHPATRRALALIEVSRNDIADEELRLLWGRKGTAVQDDLLALTANLNLPAVQIRLARASGTGKLAPTSTRYPLPDWQPAGGFSIDRALLFAMVRKESDFRSRAKSRAGAGGLMQVMPATARFISRKGSKLLRRNRHRLFEPEFNMALGQQYISHLLDMEYVDGNLFMALAAYNGGPGSLLEWRKEVPYQQDPFLFIESIGFYETRDYIERVMANLWLYRMRLGQDTPSLDAIAAGAWPALEALDTPQTAEALQRAVTLTQKGQTIRAEN